MTSLEELLNAAFCRELTQSETEQLECQLLSNDASLKQFFDGCQLEVDLDIYPGTAPQAKCLPPIDNSRIDPGGTSEPLEV